jgi:hypothetical protein
MGLPMCHVLLLLRKMNIHPNADFFAGCETLLEYQCPIDITGLRDPGTISNSNCLAIRSKSHPGQVSTPATE